MMKIRKYLKLILQFIFDLIIVYYGFKSLFTARGGTRTSYGLTENAPVGVCNVMSNDNC